MRSEPAGVSVIICCHNSAARLPPTLQHLAAQHVPKEIPWEVIVVDNASTDDTAAVAKACWPAGAPARLQVVEEPRPGLRFARDRGQAASCFPILSFIDDDNWVGPNWVLLVSEIMSSRPDVAACGGVSEAVCEVPAPPWFERYGYCYAVGPQGGREEDPAGPRPQLWGAGLSLRRSALDELLTKGFKPLAVGRQGKQLGAGEDTELCLALRLAGWTLWYDPRLRLKHYIPANRLRWGYLRGLVRGFGATVMDPYWYEADEKQKALPAWRRSWPIVVLRELRALPGRLPGWWRGRGGGGEGDDRVVDTDRAFARLGALLRGAGSFGDRCRTVREAAWRKKAS